MIIPHDNQAIYYKVIDINGSNEPWLTMVHGFTHNHNYFSSQIVEFQQNFRLLLPDLRGHGRSAGAAGPYGIEEYADDLVAILDENGIVHTHYWGTHTGAAIGLVLAIRQPERFSSLILEGTFLPGYDMPRVVELIDRARSLAQSKGKNAALDDWFSHAEWFEYIRNHPQQCRADEHRKMTFEFKGTPLLSTLTPRQVTHVSECLHNVHQPTLIYNGKYDLHDFKLAASYLACELSNAEQEQIPEAGGFPGWENPETVNKLVRNFLEEA